MPSIDFPSSPSLNQTYTFGERTWKWNGEGWIAATSVSAGSTGPIAETQQVLSTDLTISTGYNGMSAGPVEVAATYSVTVPENATWVVL